MRRTLLALTLGATFLTTTPAWTEGLTAMSDAERQAFRDEVRAYLLDNPEVLMEALDVLQQRQDAAAAQAEQVAMQDNRDFIFNDPNSWVGGNPDGDITVVEFMDYRCGYCRKAYEEVAELIESDGNIRFVVKEFPILGEESNASARFAVAVLLLHGDAAYEAAHDALIGLRGSPDQETLARLAQDLGHEPGAIMDRMNGDDVTSIIAANHAVAQQLNITGTPTFFVGDTILRGYLPLDQMRAVVAQERAG